MSLLDIFFLASGGGMFLLALRAIRQERVNVFRFLVFLLGSIILVVFTLFPSILVWMGSIFGLERGADALVYMSIVFLVYSVFSLFKRVDRFSTGMIDVIRESALSRVIKNDRQPEVTLVIAAYNEEDVIEETIENVFRTGYTSVVVVDDGSSDNTYAVLLNLQKKYQTQLIVLHHMKNCGQGAALETGFSYIRRGCIRTQYVVTYDADGQHDISDLSHMLSVLKKTPTVDIVLGSRFLDKKPENMPFFRRLVIKGGILFTWLISGLRLTDTHNGYRVLRASVLGKVHISMPGMEHASEIIDIIHEQRIPYKEVPVTIHYNDYSLRKGQKASNSIRIAFGMMYRKFFG